MSDNQEWTVGRLLTWTTDYLKQHGAENPRLDAEVLLAHARGCERIMLYTAYAEPVAEDVRTAFRGLVKGRAGGMPVAYLVGKKEFFSLPFRVSPAVLIPRPETEHLVTAALDVLKVRPADAPPAEVLDLGTGSGAIAVAIASHEERCDVTASDVSPQALAIARENAAANDVVGRIDFVQSDLFAAFPADRQWDLIVSNPPYVGEQERGTLAKEVVDNEPGLALFGGATGIEFTKRLIPEAASHLPAGGWLMLEINAYLEAEVRKLLADEAVWKNVAVQKDLSSLPRVVKAQRT
jgi:release factor glutamine methyltransferase